MKSSARTSHPSFGYLLGDATRKLRTQFDRRAAAYDLTRAQWRALRTLGRHEGLSQTALAELIEMEPIPVGRVIDRLQQAGFVERRADPEDRRRWCLYLTEKARAVNDDMEVIVSEMRAECLRGIPSADVETFLDVLARIKNNLDALDAASSAPESN
ncbi:MAG TPA: MarR family transcriptional regulator [Rhodanobacteraceae bacterium]|nr:MarR family transcriptional regulator [Rhodanobacteraceae bacterium]